MNQSPKTVVALYRSHHDLPFWSGPGNPYAIFIPDRYKNIAIENYLGAGRIHTRQGLTSSHYMFPILMGLLNLDLPKIMAHVSINFDRKNNGLVYTKRIWIQLTTIPHEYELDGNTLPIVVRNGKVMVDSLCLTDNQTHSPLQFLGDEVVPGEETSTFWTNFFRAKLQAERVAAQQNLAEAKHRARLLSSILK